ncbi:uncharacterized protein [Prorops nasuta]|uniref:uncharacterized protein n=1 Tax=Prorops nasuta TaxID=863751 RepID=UPI0034CD5A9B
MTKGHRGYRQCLPRIRHLTITDARALLDQGSESSIISESLVQSLGLCRRRVNIPIVGVGASKVVTVHHSVTFRLKSTIEKDFEADFNALVLSRPSGHLPSTDIPISNLPSFANLQWADGTFYISGGVDLILGVDAYALIIRHGLKHLDGLQVIAQNTAFGWTFSSRFQTANSNRQECGYRTLQISVLNSAEDHLSEILKQFWLVEEVPMLQDKLSPENSWCEKFYETTHSGKSDGRYIVRLPLRSEPPHCADSTRRLAYNSFLALMRRFERNPELEAQYRHFMREYEELGHMRLVPKNERSFTNAWYVPHHPVMHQGVASSKLRVVFDASRRTADNHSLNDFLLPGPSLQTDLPLISMGWRQYRYAFTADMVKMYRQIVVDPTDQDFQRILWSSTPGEPPVDYRLTTVTYGTSAAPYLAIKTLMQLAKDEGHNFPSGAHCLLHQTYVDDIFSGAEHLNDARHIKDQLISILSTACITLDKWAANDPHILNNNLKSVSSQNEKTIRLDQTVKTLDARFGAAPCTIPRGGESCGVRADTAAYTIACAKYRVLVMPLLNFPKRPLRSADSVFGGSTGYIRPSSDPVEHSVSRSSPDTSNPILRRSSPRIPILCSGVLRALPGAEVLRVLRTVPSDYAHD